MDLNAAHATALPFTVGYAKKLGLTKRQLYSPRLIRPLHGVRVIEAPDDLIARCRAQLVVMAPGAAFSHTTAAQLHGIPMSRAMEADGKLHVIQPIDSGRMRRPGTSGHRFAHPREIVTVQGLPVVGLADTWVDLGETVGRGKPTGVDDLVVAGDAVATRLRSRDPLLAALAPRVRPRGKRALLEAYELVRFPVLSAPETSARLMFVRVGLPEPRPNAPVYSQSVPGLLLGFADLYWEIERPPLPPLRLVGEYQGAEYHSSDEQKLADRVRSNGFESAGCHVEEIWAVDMSTAEARRATCVRFAKAGGFPVEQLRLSEVESHFYSQHAIDLAIQRDVRRNARFSER